MLTVNVKLAIMFDCCLFAGSLLNDLLLNVKCPLREKNTSSLFLQKKQVANCALAIIPLSEGQYVYR